MNKHEVKPKIEDGWKNALHDEFTKDYFIELKKKLIVEKQNHIVYPPSDSIFAAFNLTPFNHTKVVIIGQDPYHGPNQANGLCFSVSDEVNHPPSLINIFKEISDDIGISYPKSGNLEPWAKQGVLLLNATLTVRKSEANSHSNIGWQNFTDEVIKQLSSKRNDIIFLLWGGFAKKKIKLIDQKKHHILTAGHPSPLSANRGYWFGNKNFSKTNQLLRSLNKEPIDWKID